MTARITALLQCRRTVAGMGHEIDVVLAQLSSWNYLVVSATGVHEVAAGENPVGNIIDALFCFSLSSKTKLFQMSNTHFVEWFSGVY